MPNKNHKRKIHLIGICGKGMSGLALLLKDKNCQVTGSDNGFYEPVAGLLKKNGIKFAPSYAAKNIPKNVDTIIIGKHASLNKEENEEVKAAFESGIKIQSLPEALADISTNKENTVVAGSYGKSTVTALLSWCLGVAKQNPSYFIGAVPLGFKTNAKLNKGKDFIFEGDEYPSANWDITSKFLYLNPTNLILISAEHDHLNVFPTEEDYIKPYKKLVALLPIDGLLVAAGEGKNVLEVVKKAKCKVVTYGLHTKSKYYALNIKYGPITSFDLYNGKHKVTTLKTTLLGKHNIENVVGVAAFILEKNIITITQLQKGIETFKGLSGRIDLKTEKSSVLVYEGFGSSYSKAKSVFDALKLHHPTKKLITIFEPHTFSWRNKEAKKWYKDIFHTSDFIILLPPPEHGKNTHQQMTFQEITKEVKKANKKVYALKSEEDTLNMLKKITKKDDLIVLVSSGSLLGLTISVPKLMEKLFPKKNS